MFKARKGERPRRSQLGLEHISLLLGQSYFKYTYRERRLFLCKQTLQQMVTRLESVDETLTRLFHCGLFLMPL